ncbi:MAG: PQQ-binding-like beta-propeller repeat protein [Saprospiraceae bacterium]|nr:PQQ-binding-like beta-propeller repeat protein [Saprospiraceae bacterium]
MAKYCILLVMGVVALGCRNHGKNNSWVAVYPGLGTNSSPRLADLTGDGVPDVVMGAGKNEWVASDTAVIALDGQNGNLLWQVAAPNQVVGSALFLEVTGDGIKDVFIGGRSAFMVGIDGHTGKLLWKYDPSKDTTGVLKFAHYCFFNPQTIPDQTGDGIPDLLVANGGNAAAFPNSNQFRDPGVLMVINSKTGEIIAAAAMPDGRETYQSPVVHDFAGNNNPEIIIGTGGETIGGNLYRCSLAAVLTGNLSGAKALHYTGGHGFIAPPVLADLTGDGTLDIVANNQGGIVFAFDGRSDSLLWSLTVPGTEASSSLAVGYFNDDEVPDFFGQYAVGVWPDNKGARQIAIDGQNGHILKEFALGCTGFFSPIAWDFDQDGFDEVLMSVNDYNCTGIFVTDIEHYLAIFDMQDGNVRPFTERKEVKNLSSTPWLGDMDEDGFLDVVYCVQANTSKIIEFFGMAVLRHESRYRIQAPSDWGGYMGTTGDGIFRKKSRLPQ